MSGAASAPEPWSEAWQHALVARANLAPSVHNTQPARWHFDRAAGTITLLADPARALAVGDPALRDAGLSCGAALEGTVIALADAGFRAGAVTDLWAEDAQWRGLRPVARITPESGADRDPLSDAVANRATWRGRFLAASDAQAALLAEWAAKCPDVALASSPQDLAMLARLNDDISLRFFAHAPYRRELLHWMRLSRRHPDYGRDGMNLEALRLSPLEGMAANRIFGSRLLFGLIGALGLSRGLLGEAAKTESATGIVLFHRPEAENPLQSGRVFYRLWLELAAMGLSLWPMAVVADDPEAARHCRHHFALPAGERLITLLRAGPAPQQAPKARLPVSDLIIKG